MVGVQLCFTDTDKSRYVDMREDHDCFDFSDYPDSHCLHSNQNKKVIGKMKDGWQGHVMNLLALNPKCTVLFKKL